MNDYGLVSIITPAYNCSRFIGETIRCIRKQTYTNWELLITDDCSTDGTYELLESAAKEDPRIRIFRLKKNSGPGVARNNSIENARGRFIAFCDSEDCWLPQKLERQLEFMVEGGYALTYTSYEKCDESGRLVGYVKCPKRMTRSKIRVNNGIGCLTAIYDTEKVGKRFMPRIRKRQDWCLWIDIINRVGEARGLRQVLARYRVRRDSVSSNKSKNIRYNYEVYREMYGYSHAHSVLIMSVCFLPYYFFKRFRQKIDFINYRKK